MTVNQSKAFGVRLALLLLATQVAACAQAPIDSDPIRPDQDPWERVGTSLGKKPVAR